MIHLIHGPDALLARAELDRLLSVLDPDGMSTSWLDGRETTVPAVIAAIGSVGFFSDRRIVVVRDLMSRGGRGGKAASDPAGESASPGLDLSPLFPAVPAQNVLILFDPALATVPAAVKKAAQGAEIYSGVIRRGKPLIEWVQATAREAGGELEPRAAQALLELRYPQTWANAPSNPRYDRPPDTEALRHDIERLVLYAYPAPVTAAVVHTLIESGPNDRVFSFIDAVMAGRLDAAITELDKLLLAGEEPAKLLAQLQQQAELAALVAAAPRKAPVDIGKDVALPNPQRMTGIAGSIRGRSPAQTLGSVRIATEIDRMAKTGRLRQPADALYQLIAGLSQRSTA